MEHIMDAHSGRKLDLEGDRRTLCQQGEGTKVTGLKGGGWSAGVVGCCDVLGAKKDLIADLVRVGTTVSIGMLGLHGLCGKETIAGSSEG